MLKLPATCVLLLIAQSVFWSPHAIAEQQPGEIADTTQGARVGILPLPIFYYTPETGIAGGGAMLVLLRPKAVDTAVRPSSIVLDLIYTEKRQIIAEIFSDLYLTRGTYHITGSVQYSRYPLKFFGIGSETSESYEEPFTSQKFRLSVDALRRVMGALSAGPSLLYEDRSLSELKPDGILQSGTILGNHGGRTLGVGGVLHWDTRDNLFMPASGCYYVVSLRTSMPGSDFKFSHLTVDLRQYLAITETSTLAVQALAALAAGAPPFYMLPQLGGPNIMRGYYEGRYRDKKLLALQTEYRFPIFWKFGGAAFAGVGNVGPTLQRFALSSIKPSYGFGLRYVIDPVEKMCIRIDVGFGRGTSGLYVTANEAF